LCVLRATLGILAQIIGLRGIVAAERALTLLSRQTILLSLSSLLLAKVLVVVIVVVPALGVGGVVGREFAGGRAEGAAGLLLALRLSRLCLAGEAAIVLVLRTRNTRLLLSKAIKWLRRGEGGRLLGCGLTKAAILLGVLRCGLRRYKKRLLVDR